MYEAPARTLEDVIREHRQIREELERVRAEAASAKLQAATADENAGKAQENAEKAHERINRLEVRLDDISTTLLGMSNEVSKFDQKQDVFLTNTWQLIKYLLILLAGIITLLGGLVGVKLTIPL